MVDLRRTDLAIESRELYKSDSGREVPGVEVDQEKLENITITRVNIFDPQGSMTMGKPMGNYITLEIPDMRMGTPEFNHYVSRILSIELNRLMRRFPIHNVLVVGLGNWNVTPDALGPKVVSRVVVTRHVFEFAPEEVKPGMLSVSAIAPGVLGITGIETADIIKGVVDRIKPDLIVAIDALASRSTARVASTIQISDTGVSPGAGIGNRRTALDYSTLGIPVIALGIPTVVDAATMANDTIDLLIDSLIKATPQNSQFYQLLKDLNRDEKYSLIKEVISPYDNLMVTPKEIDEMIDDMAGIVAEGINIALHSNMYQ
ncbi:spore protease [Caldanaerobius fijiensis DSM 17918]|uniref:Germination protease n=1 Tax=Caldanaerobius fijiensis DSM 17918 TaxID=1121256 RepID=A0A1M4SGB3_9THEO|nr:GPR endopeptidase [Caldanaerobius fijiensis]SHE31273.1 spore protease [Caldanaerobius fijiensis DSM 17918]